MWDPVDVEGVKKNMADTLDDIHQDLVGATAGIYSLTDIDKIIGVLGVLAEKVEALEDHSHPYLDFPDQENGVT